MPGERHQMNRPIGDTDLTGGRPMEEDINLTSGGIGPDPTASTSTGKVGGMGNTGDGAEARDDRLANADDEEMGSGEVIDTNLG